MRPCLTVHLCLLPDPLVGQTPDERTGTYWDRDLASDLSHFGSNQAHTFVFLTIRNLTQPAAPLGRISVDTGCLFLGGHSGRVGEQYSPLYRYVHVLSEGIQPPWDCHYRPAVSLATTKA